MLVLVIIFWKPKGQSDENTTAPTISDYSLNLQLTYLSVKTRLEFRVLSFCLKQDKAKFNHGKTVNIYIVYELDMIYVKTNPTLLNDLFGAVSLTKNDDINKYKYSWYGIGFDRGNVFSVGNGFGRNVITFGTDMSSLYVDNKGKNILILGESPTQGSGEHSLTAEKNVFS